MAESIFFKGKAWGASCASTESDKQRGDREEAARFENNSAQRLTTSRKEFHFTAIAPEGDWSTAAVYIQDQLRSVGVRMEIQTLAMEVISDRRISGDYEALIQTFNLYALENNRISGYSNPEVIKLLNASKDDFSPDWRDRLFQKLIPIFKEDHPVTILHPQVFFTIVHRRLHGLSSPFHSSPEKVMEYLWIEEEE